MTGDQTSAAKGSILEQITSALAVDINKCRNLVLREVALHSTPMI